MGASLVVTLSAAAQEDRIALVIGNTAYDHVVDLPNPEDDARAISAVLRGLGFDVHEHVDLDRNATLEAIRDFGRRLSDADVALLFYAGHAIQYGGINYLVPTDAELEAAGDIDFELVNLELIIKQMQSQARISLIFLDACRDNPFDKLKRAVHGTPTAGLAKVSESAMIGTYIAYATFPDRVAYDGEGEHSPFTTALLKHIDAEGVELRTMMSRVRKEVFKATAEEQLPWDASSLLTEFYFRPSRGGNVETADQPLRELNQILALADPEQQSRRLSQFLRKNADSPYAEIARLKLRELTPPPATSDNRQPMLAFMPSLVVEAGRLRTPLRIPPPHDPDPGDQLRARVVELPNIGTVRSRGLQLNLGDELSIEQLTNLEYYAAPGTIGEAGQLAFQVYDSRGGSVLGAVSIRVLEFSIFPESETAAGELQADRELAEQRDLLNRLLALRPFLDPEEAARVEERLASEQLLEDEQIAAIQRSLEDAEQRMIVVAWTEQERKLAAQRELLSRLLAVRGFLDPIEASRLEAWLASKQLLQAEQIAALEVRLAWAEQRQAEQQLAEQRQVAEQLAVQQDLMSRLLALRSYLDPGETAELEQRLTSDELLGPDQIAALRARLEEAETEQLSEQNVVRLFYGTDREDVGTLTPDFGGDRGGRLQLGRVYVSIPKAVHRIGQVERPPRITLPLIKITVSIEHEDAQRHFVLQQIERLDRADFVLAVKQAVGAARDFEDQAFVFVHGYNTSFEAAAYRAAQLAHDLQFDGAPILYSWPSRGSIEDYEYDQNSARQTRPFLQEFIKIIREEIGVETVHLIAHSLGNDPLMEVLAEMNAYYRAEAPLFNQIILAAPDIDAHLFHQLANKIRGVARGITLYASAHDRAIEAAKFYAGGIPRAGDIPTSGPLIAAGIDTIDVTVLGENFLSLNHSGYAESRLLLNDIGLLFRSGLRPPRKRSPTLLELYQEGAAYWSFPR